MDDIQIKPGTVIGNVNVLDLTKATERSVTAIRKIGNVNILVYSKETAPLVPRLTIDNLNVSVEVPAAPKITIGQTVISRESTQGESEPLHHVVVGQMMIEPEVTGADL